MNTGFARTTLLGFGVVLMGLSLINFSWATCVSFNGSNARVVASSIDVGLSNKLTIEAWIKPTVLTNSMYSDILRQGRPDLGVSPQFILAFRNFGKSLVFGLNTMAGAHEMAVVVDPNTFTDGNWHHVAGSYDGVIKRLIVDGVELGATNHSGDIRPAGHYTALVVGGALEWPEFYPGLIDEVRVWAITRTTDDIAQRRNQTLLGNESGLTAHWRFDEGIDKLSEEPINERDGLLSEAVWAGDNAPLQPVAGLPLVGSRFASQLSTNSARLSGVVNALGLNATGWIDYGLTTNYGFRTAPTNLGSAHYFVPFAFTVSNLLTGQLYHWRAAASNNLAVAFGDDRVFITSGSNFGASLLFTGTNESVSATGNPDAATGAGLTIEAWIKPFAFNGGMSEIIRAGDYWNPDFRLRFTDGGKSLSFAFTTLGCGFTEFNLPVEPAQFLDDEWHHIAATYDGSRLRVYRDGLRLGTMPFFTGCIFSFVAPSWIGNSFNGKIDELRVWRTARSERQIEDFKHRSVSGDQEGLSAYWRFDEGTGGVIRNCSADGRIGTLSNQTWTNENAPVLTRAGAPSVFTLSAMSLTTNTATLRGYVAPFGWPTLAYFQYGTTTAYGNTTEPQPLDAGWYSASLTNLVADLLPATFYHFRLVASNSAGVALGADNQFLTPNIPGSTKILWTYPIYVSAPPAVAPDGTVYIGTYEGVVAITNAGSVASNKWTFPCTDVKGIAIGFDGTLYVANASQDFYALNPDGSQKWVYSFEYYGSSPPAIGRDNTIYVVGGSTLFALTSDGVKKWSYPLNGPGIPALGRDETIYIRSVTQPPTLFALNRSGALKWSTELPNGDWWDIGALALGANDTIYVGSSGVHAFSSTGIQLWFSDQAATGIVVGEKGLVYASRGIDATLFAFKPNGREEWHLDLPYRCQWRACMPPTTPAVDAEGTAYYTASNSVLAISSIGQLQWAVTLPNYAVINASSTVIDQDGTIYAGLSNVLFAIQGAPAVGSSPWPMFQQNARHTGKVETPAMLNLQLRNDANFEFHLYAQLGQTNVIETSTNLILWTPWTNVVVTNVPMDVIDLTASNSPTRFYRAVVP